ncbi:hypothetical protein MRB53_010438 [Persea americana]|uniref:Uncharacterized protein n=1 Tax=Persea americana TaxID=3435 RepID=A0ACC2LT07_PERAE|nr:hypothetical protein MRB53_010438 [Persea americana]
MAALNPEAPAFNPPESNPPISHRSPHLPTFPRSPYHPFYDPNPIPFYYPSSLVYCCFLTADMQPTYRMCPDRNLCYLNPLPLQNPTPKIPASFFYQHPSLTNQFPNPQLPSKHLQEKVEEKKDGKEAPASTLVALAEETKPGEAVPTVSKCSILKENTRSRIEGRRDREKVWVQNNRSLEYGRWGKTTLMIKHIPVKYTKEILLQFLDEHCIAENGKLTSEDQLKKNFMSAYDFIYLPIDFRTKCNKGYAFVNFTNAIGACRLRRVLEGYKWKVLGSRKICHITCARIQGREALKKHFESSKFFCETEAYLPVFFDTYRNGSCGFESFTVGIRVPPSEKQQPK